MTPSTQLLQAIAVTAELTRTQLSEMAARVMAQDLAEYPEHQVLAALVRCRRELRGQMTIADVLNRLDDGRPGAEEAFAMLPQSEDESVVWTEEMAGAWGVASCAVDRVAARMVFKEVYTKAVQAARDEHKPVKWTASLGRDPRLRDQALQAAVEKKRLTHDQVAGLLSHKDESINPRIAGLLAFDEWTPERAKQSKQIIEQLRSRKQQSEQSDSLPQQST